MNKVKTTLNLNAELKKLAEKKAIDEGITLQEFVNKALYKELSKLTPSENKGDKDIERLAKDIDSDMGSLRREDFYDWT